MQVPFMEGKKKNHISPILKKCKKREHFITQTEKYPVLPKSGEMSVLVNDQYKVKLCNFSGEQLVICIKITFAYTWNVRLHF